MLWYRSNKLGFGRSYHHKDAHILNVDIISSYLDTFCLVETNNLLQWIKLCFPIGRLSSTSSQNLQQHTRIRSNTYSRTRFLDIITYPCPSVPVLHPFLSYQVLVAAASNSDQDSNFQFENTYLTYWSRPIGIARRSEDSPKSVSVPIIVISTSTHNNYKYIL
jgi:hypothetical protein